MTAAAMIAECERVLIQHSDKADDAIVMHLVGPAGSDKLPVVELREDGRAVYGVSLAKVKALLARARAVGLEDPPS